MNGISDPFEKKNTILHCAVANQDLISVSLILELKPFLRKNSEGQTARDLAVKNQDTSCIKLIDEYREQDLKDTQERERRLIEKEKSKKQKKQQQEKEEERKRVDQNLKEQQDKKGCCVIL